MASKMAALARSSVYTPVVQLFVKECMDLSQQTVQIWIAS